MKKILFFIFISLAFVFTSGCAAENDLEIVHVTDIHFAGREYFSYEGSYAEINDSNGSGKQMKYLDDILDAFISEMIEQKPDYIVLSGDNTYDGAKESHLLLAEKLSVLAEAGIKVLILPGNHDIKFPTCIFPNGEIQETSAISPEDFREIYADFGYTDGISYDEDSLSYVYDSGEGVRFFMLDTNITYGLLYGKLNPTKLAWLEKELIACNEAGDVPIVAGHHNLLSHNEMFDFGYILSNHDEVEKLLTEHGVTLYLSGHMHTQHIASTDKITDIVGGAFSVYPHRYGVISCSSDGWKYESRTTDVSAYAENSGISEENLLNYDEYGYYFFYNNAYDQAKEALSSVISDSELVEKYADFSAQLNVAYFGGNFDDIDFSFKDQFLEDSSGTRWGVYMGYIMKDIKDNTHYSRVIE